MIKELYYWMMYFLGKDGKKTEIFGHNSYLLISMLVAFNILTVAIVISYLFNVKLKELGIDKQTTQLIGITFGVIVIGFNHFYLYKNQNKICQKYDELKGRRRVTGMILFWVYVIASIILLFTLGPALT
jgi:hypothetical protein